MPTTVEPVPEGFNTVSAYLVVPNCLEALEFYSKAFGAIPFSRRMPGPAAGETLHAAMRLGNSTVMMTDENPQWGVQAPGTLGGTSVSLHVYVEDADAAFARALDAGCTEAMPLQDMFWGDRYGKVRDPFGHEWAIATHQEDVSPAETAHRAKDALAAMGKHPGREESAGSRVRARAHRDNLVR